MKSGMENNISNASLKPISPLPVKTDVTTVGKDISEMCLYNSRITKTYLEYLLKYHPEINIASLLSYAGMTNYQVQDPAHWFTQQQVDTFQKKLVEMTGDQDIARKAGRFMSSSDGLGPARQHLLGFMTPTAVYLLMQKLYPILSRAANIRTVKLSSNKVEIISTPKPGVNEKLYQCTNRIGTFESLAKFFTGSNATIEHPSCFHRGDAFCRYIVSWKKTPAVLWGLLRKYTLLIGFITFIALIPILSFTSSGNS